MINFLLLRIHSNDWHMSRCTEKKLGTAMLILFFLRDKTGNRLVELEKLVINFWDFLNSKIKL